MSSEEFAKEHKLNKAIFPGTQGGPLMHTKAAKAICFKEALDPSFTDYSKRVVKNAKALSEGLKKRGFNIVSDGTDNHLMLVDLRSKGVTGKDAEELLDKVHITCNKNTIPDDSEKASITSGIRLGTPAVTSRGMNEEDMDIIAEAITLSIEDLKGNETKVKKMVKELANKYPLLTNKK